MVLLERILTLTKIFQTVGLAPFSYSVSTGKWETNRSLGCITFIFIIVTVITTVLPTIFHEHFINPKNSRIAKTTVNVICIAINLHTFCALIENFCKRHRHIRLMHLFQKLEISINRTQSVRLEYGVIQRMFRRFLIFEFFEIALVILLEYDLTVRIGDQRSVNVIIVYMIPFILSTLSSIQAISYISLLFRNIEALDRFTDDLMAKGNVSVNRWFVTPARFRKNTIDAPNLILLKQIYRLIFECAIVINNLMYWSLPIGLINYLFLLTFHSFWIIRAIFGNHPSKIAIIIFNSFWSTIISLNILLITMNCKRSRDTVSRPSIKSRFINNLNYENIKIFIFLFVNRLQVCV